MDKNILYINEYASKRNDEKGKDWNFAKFEHISSHLLVIHQHSGVISNYLQNSIHSHNFYEAEFVYSGKGIHIHNNSCLDMEKRCAYLRSPNNFIQLLKKLIIRFVPINCSSHQIGFPTILQHISELQAVHYLLNFQMMN